MCRHRSELGTGRRIRPTTPANRILAVFVRVRRSGKLGSETGSEAGRSTAKRSPGSDRGAMMFRRLLYGPKLFHDRTDAGRRLAQRLLRYRGADTIVLALPRGGVEVGYE